MSNQTPDFNGFPTDNSSTTNLKYDIIASKFMTGVCNHQMRTAPAPNLGVVFGLIGAVLQIIISIIIIIFGGGLKWLSKKL